MRRVGFSTLATVSYQEKNFKRNLLPNLTSKTKTLVHVVVLFVGILHFANQTLLFLSNHKKTAETTVQH